MSYQHHQKHAMHSVSSPKDCKAMVHHHHHEEEKRGSLHLVSMRTESPDVVLRDAYISAKDIAVERPLAVATAPPTNFAMVLPGLYRSSYPKAADYPFMKSLNLKTIVTLVGDDLPDGFQHFITNNGIKHEIFDMVGTKKADIPIKTMQSIIAVVGNRKNYPLLVHCNQGKHRTGCVVGVIRKASEWDTASIINEYTKYAEPKVREKDVQYLTNFKLCDLALSPSTLSQAPFVLRTFYGMVMLASFTLSFWVYSTTRLLILTTV